jgi:hypothetical protein
MTKSMVYADISLKHKAQHSKRSITGSKPAGWQVQFSTTNILGAFHINDSRAFDMSKLHED